MTRDRDTPRPGRVPRHLLSRARARVCQAQGHLPSPSFPAAASAQCASYCCLETILGVDAGHYSERSEDGAHINFTLLAAGRDGGRRNDRTTPAEQHKCGAGSVFTMEQYI